MWQVIAVERLFLRLPNHLVKSRVEWSRLSAPADGIIAVCLVPRGPFFGTLKRVYVKCKEFNLENSQWSYGWLIEATLEQNKKQSFGKDFKVEQNPFQVEQVLVINVLISLNEIGWVFDHILEFILYIVYLEKSFNTGISL